MGSFMAGPLVVDMALKAPGRIRSMILLGPLGTLASPATALLRLITGFYRLPGIPRLIRVPFVRSSAEWCDRRILGPRRMREIFYEAASAPVAFEDLYEMHKRPPNTHAHVALMWCIRNMKYARVIARLSEIGCPSLIIHGEQDDWIPVRYAELLHRSIARSSLVVVPRTRHAPELERVDIVSNEIRMFLSAAGSGRQTAGDFGSPASQAGTQP
jgi:pimeloyl-ACP methyl ester carboxylesterase